MPQTDDKANEKIEAESLPLFNDIEDEKIRAYNRCVTLSTLIVAGREGVARQYLSAVPPGEAGMIMAIAVHAKEHGFEQTLKEIRSA